MSNKEQETPEANEILRIWEIPVDEAIRALAMLVEFGDPNDPIVQEACVTMKMYSLDQQFETNMVPRFGTDGERIYYVPYKKKPMGFSHD